MVLRPTIDAIRERANLVEVVSQTVTLKRKGTSWLGLCPFHQEKTPSFNVVPHKGIYHCFGCGEGGDVFTFLMKTRGITFMDAVKELGASCGIVVEDRQISPEEQRRQKEKASLYDVCEAAAKFFQSVLKTRPEAAGARAYLEKRGISAATQDRFRVGFAPDSWDALLDHLHRQGIDPDMAVAAGLAKQREHGRGAYAWFRGRLMVPILDPRGRVIAFGGRVLEGDGPKYVNSPETEIYKKSKTLYALSAARSGIQRKDRVIIVEGYFDVMTMHQAGFDETVAACGTALTEEHLRELSTLTRNAYALFDTDAAGLRAAARSLKLFRQFELDPYCLSFDDAKDPDEYLQRHPATDLEALVARSPRLFSLMLHESKIRNGLTPMGRQKILDEVVPLMFRGETGVRDLEVAYVAGELTIDERVLREEIRTKATRDARTDASAPAAPELPQRWSGSKDLNHLLWLLLHFPDAVSPVFAEMNPEPESVSDRPTVLQAIVLLVQGVALPDVLDQIRDPALARVLLQAAAREGLYSAAQAPAAARQIISGMEVRRLDDALARVGRAIAACQSGADGTGYIDLFRQRQDLQRRKQAFLAAPSQREGR